MARLLRIWPFFDDDDQSQLSTKQQVLPSGIASAEAFGTALIRLVVAPSAIGSAEAFGTAALRLVVAPTGIASAEAIGTARIVLRVAPAGLGTAEAFGVALIRLVVAPAGIASGEAFGSPTLTTAILPAGVASGESVPAPRVVLIIFPSGIASAERFGAPSVAPSVAPGGIPSAEAFGTPAIVLSVGPSGIPSAEAFGLATVTGGTAPAPTPTPSDAGGEILFRSRGPRVWEPLEQRKPARFVQPISEVSVRGECVIIVRCTARSLYSVTISAGFSSRIHTAVGVAVTGTIASEVTLWADSQAVVESRDVAMAAPREGMPLDPVVSIPVRGELVLSYRAIAEALGDDDAEVLALLGLPGDGEAIPYNARARRST